MTSIRTRLLFWLIFPLTAVAGIVSFETFYSARQISNELYDKTLLAGMLTISENVVASNGTLLAENTLNVLTENLGDQFFYYVFGPNGAFVTGYSGYPKIPSDIDLKDGKPTFYDGVYQGHKVRVVTMRQLLSGRELNGWTTITTWQKTTERANLTLSLFGRSLIRLIAMILAAGVIVWVAVSFGLRPLKRLQQAIETRTPSDLTPIRRTMPMELTGIVGSMNNLFARVARSKTNRERFIGDAAHQLRNPIAALKVQAEVALEAKDNQKKTEGLEQIVDVANNTSVMVNQMLTSARAHALDADTQELLDMSKVVQDVARSIAPKALEKDQDFSIDANTEIFVVGDKVLLREAIANLIDNAIKYSPSGSAVHVKIYETEDMVAIEISDSGRSFTEDEFLRHCLPFFTGSNEQSGSGLGLAIAKDVSVSHGGYLNTKPQADGLGKTITITLPKQPATCRR